MSTPAQRRKMMKDRICYFCLEPIAEAGAVWHGSLGILAHRGDCSDVVNSLYKDYSRSKRGRFRPVGTVRQLVEEARSSTPIQSVKSVKSVIRHLRLHTSTPLPLACVRPQAVIDYKARS
jgi:hypothetical protein